MIELALSTLSLIGIWLSYRYPWWRKAVPYDHPRILMYHMIAHREHAGPRPNLAVSPAMFERQISYLEKAGWRFATVSELIANPVTPKTVAITFDDGYRDNLTNALPILLRYRALGTLYLIADRDQPLTEGGLANGVPLAPLLTDDEVHQLLASGAIELGAHTLSHRNLTTTDASMQQHELSEGKRLLERKFSQTIDSFAYPFGGYNEQLPEKVARAGFTNAVTTSQGISTNLAENRLRLKRIKISGRDNFLTFRVRLRVGRKR